MRTISLISMVTAALLAPAATRAQERRPSSPGAFAALYAGAEATSDSPSMKALALRLEGSLDLGALGPKVDAALVVSLGLAHFADESPVVLPTGGSVAMEQQLSTFELVPAARFHFLMADRVWLVADVGAGVTYTAAAATVDLGGLQVPGNGAGAAAVVRVAFGATVVPTPDVRLSMQVVGLSLRLGDGVPTTYDFLIGVSHRL